MDAELYSAAGVSVTPTLLRVGKTSYPVNGIGSVRIDAPQKGGLILVGGILCLIGFVVMANGHAGGGILAVLLGGLAVYGAFARPKTLVVRTSSGDQRALTSRDLKLLEAVQAAIEQAVAMRG